MSAEKPRFPLNDNAETDDRAQAMTHGEAANVNVNANDELADALKQRDDYLDQLQRSRAEFANYQKRAKSQADSDRVYAVGSLARDLLDAIDNLERAAEALKANAAAGIADGLVMVHKQMLATLSKHGIEPIAALGQPFDPNQHEAILQQPLSFAYWQQDRAIARKHAAGIPRWATARSHTRFRRCRDGVASLRNRPGFATML